jgi:hypothetical protein
MPLEVVARNMPKWCFKPRRVTVQFHLHPSPSSLSVLIQHPGWSISRKLDGRVRSNELACLCVILTYIRQIARVRLARSTPLTKSPSIRLAKHPSSPRENVVMTENRVDMVDRQSRCSTRRCETIYSISYLYSFIPITLGQDNEEGRAATRVHGVQVQNAISVEAMQAVRYSLHLDSSYPNH